MTKTFLRIDAVKRVTGMATSSIYEEMAKGDFLGKSRSAQTALFGSRTKSSNGRRLALLSETTLQS
jgi:hypothetical protein